MNGYVKQKQTHGYIKQRDGGRGSGEGQIREEAQKQKPLEVH